MNGAQIKKSRSVYIIGAITLGIIALLAVYFVLIATGVISAELNRITVTSSSAIKEYDGKALTDDGWSITDGKLKDGHTLSVTVTGSRTDTGESENSFDVAVFDEHGYDVTDSYGITRVAGTLSVSPRKIVVASASAEKNYDGTPLTAKSCVLTEGALVVGHTLVYTVNGTLTAAGKTQNTFIASVSDGVRDVSDNYDIEYLCGTLYVHGEMLNIKTGSAQKMYDGTPLQSDVWTLTSGTLREGDELTVTLSGTQTAVGESENVGSAVVKDAEGNVVTPMYEAVFDFGTLTVIPVTVYVETLPAYKVYDGTPLTADGWRIAGTSAWNKSGKSVVAGDYTVTATVTGERTDVGVGENTAVFEVTNRDGTPAEGVVVECAAGELAVAPRNITVQSGTKGKDYDGTPLTCDEWKIVSITQAAEGHTVRVAVSGTITFKGVTDNTIAEVVITDADGNDVTRNYNIKLQEGVLSIFGEDGSGNGGGSGEGPGGEGPGGEGPGGEGPGGEGPGGEGPGGENPGGGNTPGGSGSGGGDVGVGDKLGLGDDDGSGDAVTVMRIRSDKSGKLLLRTASRGDYNLQGWNAPTEYDKHIVVTGSGGKDVSYGMNYLAGIYLSACSLEYARLEVEAVAVNNVYLPTFTAMTELGYPVQSSDAVYGKNGGNYSLYYYSYDVTGDNGALLGSGTLGDYADIERAYRLFVYDNYIAMPDGTRQYMDKIIADNGFAELSVGEKLVAVKRFISSSATYNMKYDRALDDEPDVAVAFLDKYKEGICQHYATAGALLLRALGIPARYTLGYSATAVESEWTDVTGKDAHAWVEAYVDGVGWVDLDVTGGFAGGGSGGGTGGSGGGMGDEKTQKLTVKPHDVYMQYDEFVKRGAPLTYELDTLRGLTELVNKGFTYEFTVVGAQSELGIGESTVRSLKIFDGTGTDVTGNYSITFEPGKLQIYMREITVATVSRQKVYDGTALCGEEADVTFSGTLLSGHEISRVEMTGGITNAGNRANSCSVTITDADGNDVTYMYKVNNEFGTLTVTVRSITVTAGSAIGYMTELNGAPLTCNEYTVDGELCESETVTVSVRGSQSGVGRSDNTVEEVVIRDKNGKDVSGNYAVTVVNGTLTVLPRRTPVGASEGD